MGVDAAVAAEAAAVAVAVALDVGYAPVLALAAVMVGASKYSQVAVAAYSS